MDREETEKIKRHLGVVAGDLRSEIRLLAEGQDGLREQFDGLRHEFQEFREEVRGEFKEVRAAIRFSCAEFDGRVKTVEREPPLLKARLDWIEARSTAVRSGEPK